MNDLSSLKDAIIAREIQRIKKLTKQQLANELIDIKAKEIESINDVELLSIYGQGE